ncbi:MAG: hypothetical protein ACE5K0_10635 [Candidatus Methanofastidiosia archaeon]
MEDWDRMVESMKERIKERDNTPIEYIEKTISFFKENYHKNPQPAIVWNLVCLKDELIKLKKTVRQLRELEEE